MSMSSQVGKVTYPSIPAKLCLGKLKEASECCRILNEERAFEDNLLWQKCSLHVVEVCNFGARCMYEWILTPLPLALSAVPFWNRWGCVSSKYLWVPPAPVFVTGTIDARALMDCYVVLLKCYTISFKLHLSQPLVNSFVLCCFLLKWVYCPYPFSAYWISLLGLTTFCWGHTSSLGLGQTWASIQWQWGSSLDSCFSWLLSTSAWRGTHPSPAGMRTLSWCAD